MNEILAVAKTSLTDTPSDITAIGTYERNLSIRTQEPEFYKETSLLPIQNTPCQLNYSDMFR